jgi:hypothetical protein
VLLVRFLLGAYYHEQVAASVAQMRIFPDSISTDGISFFGRWTPYIRFISRNKQAEVSDPKRGQSILFYQ